PLLRYRRAFPPRLPDRLRPLPPSLLARSLHAPAGRRDADLPVLGAGPGPGGSLQPADEMGAAAPSACRAGILPLEHAPLERDRVAWLRRGGPASWGRHLASRTSGRPDACPTTRPVPPPRLPRTPPPRPSTTP